MFMRCASYRVRAMLASFLLPEWIMNNSCESVMADLANFSLILQLVRRYITQFIGDLPRERETARLLVSYLPLLLGAILADLAVD